MTLAVQSPGQAAITMLTLRTDGDVAVTVIGGDALHAKLDPKGCLVGSDGIWAELTPSNTLWTAHEVFTADKQTILLPEGALRIRSDGNIERLHADGSVEPSQLRLGGFREDATCAGELLLITFLAMMPSMAVSDGHPAMSPVPADSLCSAYRR